MYFLLLEMFTCGFFCSGTVKLLLEKPAQMVDPWVADDVAVLRPNNGNKSNGR
jgi:hypothetical protein